MFAKPVTKLLSSTNDSRLLTSALRAVACAASVFFCSLPVHAEVVFEGNASPGDPADWTSDTRVYVGDTSMGTITVNGGSDLTSRNATMGRWPGFTGTVTVSGIGSTWTTDDLNIGYFGSGVLTIKAGGSVRSSFVYMGHDPGSTGTATVNGKGSTWTGNHLLYIGRGGSGKLDVTDGGIVTVGTLLASLSDLSGNGAITVNGVVLDANLVFDGKRGLKQTMPFGKGGKLSLDLDGTGYLGAGYKGIGSLRIADGVSVKSVDGYLGHESGSVGTATVTGTGSKWINDHWLCIGHYGSGVLNIEAGGQVSSSYADLGFDRSSTGMATVIGGGAKWTINNWLYVGHESNGTLKVADGGMVTAGTLFASLASLSGNGTISVKGAVLDADLVFDSKHGSQQTIDFGKGGKLNLNLDGTGYLGAGHKGVGSLRIADGVSIKSAGGYLGRCSGSAGTATVTGKGSKWTNSKNIVVGSLGSGVLNITAGGEVAACDVLIDAKSLVAIDAASILKVSGEYIWNDGTIRVMAGPGSTAHAMCTPIKANTWKGEGKFQALGGRWDVSRHKFTVSATVSGTSGTPIAISLAEKQRVLIRDHTSGRSVGVSFMARTSHAMQMTFTATAIRGDTLKSLKTQLGPGRVVRGGWAFATDQALVGDLFYLSFDVGEGISQSAITLWRYADGKWTRFSAADLTHSGRYASVTTTDLGTFAVVSSAP